MADYERTLMQGKLAGLKEDRSRLTLRIEGLCSGIRTALNTLVVDIDQLDIPQAANQMDELNAAYVHYLDTITQIQRLERALNG